MKKQRTIETQSKLNNEGFSLVELIVVIAIMAILIGVMAPNMISYIERTNVSADIQFADTVRTAVKTAMMDPQVLNDDDSAAHIKKFEDAVAATELSALVNDQINGSTTVFGETIANILGKNTQAEVTVSWLQGLIRSKPATGKNKTDMQIMVEVENNDVKVTITNSKASIVVPN